MTPPPGSVRRRMLAGLPRAIHSREATSADGAGVSSSLTHQGARQAHETNSVCSKVFKKRVTNLEEEEEAKITSEVVGII